MVSVDWTLKIIATPIARKVYPISRCIHYFATAEESFTLSTFNGLARWETQTESFSQITVRIPKLPHVTSLFANCLLESHDKESILIGGEGSLYKYTPANEHWEKVMPVENKNIKCLAKDDTGHILISTDDGVFDLTNDSVRHYRHDSRYDPSLGDNEIWCMYVDGTSITYGQVMNGDYLLPLTHRPYGI